MFSLNPNSGIPIYRQLMEQLRRMISGGQLAPGDSLPSVRELALTHAVNPMTISKAYSLLEAEGLLERQRGKAMTVAHDLKPLQSRARRLALLEGPVRQLATAAQQLELDTETVLRAVKDALAQQGEDK